jgi:hypothetical protein
VKTHADPVLRCFGIGSVYGLGSEVFPINGQEKLNDLMQRDQLSLAPMSFNAFGRQQRAFSSGSFCER